MGGGTGDGVGAWVSCTVSKSIPGPCVIAVDLKSRYVYAGKVAWVIGESNRNGCRKGGKECGGSICKCS